MMNAKGKDGHHPLPKKEEEEEWHPFYLLSSTGKRGPRLLFSRESKGERERSMAIAREKKRSGCRLKKESKVDLTRSPKDKKKEGGGGARAPARKILITRGRGLRRHGRPFSSGWGGRKGSILLANNRISGGTRQLVLLKTK